MLSVTVIAAEATGFPALLMILGLVGLVVAAGIAIGGKRGRALRLAVLSALLFVAGLVIANFDNDGQETPGSLTPRITSTQDADLESVLLTASDVRSVSTLEGATAREIADVNLFEDPRGPCGTPGMDLPTEGAVGRAFELDGLTVVQLVLEGTAATDYLREQLADIREPCGPYDSTTNTGVTQHVEGIENQRLDEGEGYYSTALVRSEQGRAAFSVVALGVGDRVSFVLGIGVERIPEPDLQALVDLIRGRLS